MSKNKTKEQLRFEKEVHNAILIKGTDKAIYSDILVCKKTPKKLIQVGLKNLPILFSRKHLYTTIKKKNYKKHYKGLNEEKHIYKIPSILKQPALIINDSNEKHTGDLLILSNICDNDKFPLVISLKANSHKGIYTDISVSNYMITILGYENFDELINNAIRNNDVIYYDKKKIQEIDQFTGKKVSNALSILESNIILQQFTEKVNNVYLKAVNNVHITRCSVKELYKNINGQEHNKIIVNNKKRKDISNEK